MPALKVVSKKKTVSANGTAEALESSQTYAPYVIIKALAANTNDVYVGDSTVGSSDGYVLDAGEELTLDGTTLRGTSEELDLNEIYIDVDTNDEGVTFIYPVRL